MSSYVKRNYLINLAEKIRYKDLVWWCWSTERQKGIQGNTKEGNFSPLGLRKQREKVGVFKASAVGRSTPRSWYSDLRGGDSALTILVPLMWDDEASSGGANDKVGDWNKLPLRGWRAIAGVILVVPTKKKDRRTKSPFPAPAFQSPLVSPVGGTQQEPAGGEKKWCAESQPQLHRAKSQRVELRNRFITNMMTRRIGQGNKGGSALKFYGCWRNNSEFMSHRLQTRCSILSLKNKVLYIQPSTKLKLVGTIIDRNILGQWDEGPT